MYLMFVKISNLHKNCEIRCIIRGGVDIIVIVLAVCSLMFCVELSLGIA